MCIIGTWHNFALSTADVAGAGIREEGEEEEGDSRIVQNSHGIVSNDKENEDATLLFLPALLLLLLLLPLVDWMEC